jgi:hypothetical protein
MLPRALFGLRVGPVSRQRAHDAVELGALEAEVDLVRSDSMTVTASAPSINGSAS